MLQEFFMKQKWLFYFSRSSHSLYPTRKVRANPCIIIGRGGNQLDHHSLLLLNHLQTDRDEAEGAVVEVEPQVDCHVLPNEEKEILEQVEPLLVEEEEEVRELVREEEQQQHIWPYQSTNFYQQQCLLFEEWFDEWVRWYKEEQLYDLMNNNSSSMKELCLLQRMNSSTYLAMAMTLLMTVTQTMLLFLKMMKKAVKIVIILLLMMKMV
jgi:hypothetical protein